MAPASTFVPSPEPSASAKGLAVPFAGEALTGMPDPSLTVLADELLATTVPTQAAGLARRLLAQTPSLWHLADPIALAACHELPVLLAGGAGTGRAYLAWVIHSCSPRQPQRFVKLSCGELAPGILDRELFGIATGADGIGSQSRPGELHDASLGTLLLADIELLSGEQQARLLRVLETGEFERAGGTETETTSARILAAASGLEEAMVHGRFRHDLYYRLQGVVFRLLPLRERPEDIPPLARAMTAAACLEFAKDIMSVAPDTLNMLGAYTWPGNIRQLRIVIEQAVLACDGGVLRPKHLPLSIQGHNADHSASHYSAAAYRERSDSDERESSLIQRTLALCGNNRTRAAQALGISRVTLYKKMKKHLLLPRRRSSRV